MAFDTESGGGLLPRLSLTKEATVKIEITQRCRVRGVDCQPGDVVETDKGTAMDRIGMGRAKVYVEPPPPDPAGGEEAAPGGKTETTAPEAAEPERKKGKRGEIK